jgi:hypothetical protein
MITFSQIGSLGRLGNQLFQYAILKKISLETNYDIELPFSILQNIHHGQKCLLNNFKLPSCKFKNDVKVKNIFIEKGFYENINYRNFDEKLFQLPDDTDLIGFFQNVEYYESIKKELIHEFELQNVIQNKIKSILTEFKRPIVSLHIRRGDVSDNTNPIDYEWSNRFDENSTQYKYYTKALQLIPDNSTILLFTGGSRENNIIKDYEWCEKYFTDKRIKTIKDLNDIETFCLMSNCDYNITSFASTFSWWASFLNPNNKIIAPKKYYPTIEIEFNKIYPNDWTLIET